MKYSSIFRIGFKQLVNERSKFLALLLEVAFAAFLMIQITSMYTGILTKAGSMITNIGASMWVMDPETTVPTENIPMPDYVLDTVRSMDGVSYAVPLFTGEVLAKLNNGRYQTLNVIGLDDDSLYGHPELIEGNIKDIYADDSFIAVKDAEYAKLGSPEIGTSFEINGHRGSVVGISKVPATGLYGLPTVYTTYNRAVEYVPGTRFSMSYVLVEPKNNAAVAGIKAQVARLGYVALTKDEFNKVVSDYYIYKTGVGTNILIMTLIGFIVGLSISGQAFYTFILKNLEIFGAMKAIGATDRELIFMIVFMVTFTVLIGYGLGVGLVALMFSISGIYPNYTSVLTFGSMGIALGMVIFFALISSYVSIHRVLTIEPFDIFRR